MLGSDRCKEEWRIRNNNELQKLIKVEDIVKYTQTQRIKWWGYLNRMEDIKLVKHINDWNPIGIRTIERPKNRLRDKVMKDVKKLKLRNCIQLVKDRIAWNDLVQKTNTRVGLKK